MEDERRKSSEVRVASMEGKRKNVIARRSFY
jgi:hypothetical protein